MAGPRKDGRAETPEEQNGQVHHNRIEWLWAFKGADLRGYKETVGAVWHIAPGKPEDSIF